MCRANGAVDVNAGAARDECPGFASERIVAFEMVAGCRVGPLAADEHLVPGERGGGRRHATYCTDRRSCLRRRKVQSPAVRLSCLHGMRGRCAAPTPLSEWSPGPLRSTGLQVRGPTHVVESCYLASHPSERTVSPLHDRVGSRPLACPPMAERLCRERGGVSRSRYGGRSRP